MQQITTLRFALLWRKEYDDDNNLIYEAASPHHDDGSPLCFRIKRHLHEFWEASDAEVMMDKDNPRTWPNLDSAKAAMQADADDIVREYGWREKRCKK